MHALREPEPRFALKLRSISEFIAGLMTIPEEAFTQGHVLDYIRRHPIDPDSLTPYIYFSAQRYTRNLIYRDPLFEVIALCWSPGQYSAVHDHADQRCWMSVPIGELSVQNFRPIPGNPDRLEMGSHYVINADNAGAITEEEPIHTVRNGKGVTVSVHVYSKPITECRLFDLEQDRTWPVPLSYYSAYGRLCRASEPPPPLDET